MSQQDVQNPGTTNPADQSFAPILKPEISRTPASSSLHNSSGDVQLPAQQTAVAPSGGPTGLPVEVHAGHASQVRSQPAAVAVAVGTDRPGGLPVNVMVK